MTKARDFADIAGAVSNGKIANSDVNVSFENIVDTGTEGTKVAVGTTAQRGSTTGQWRYNTTLGFFEGRHADGTFFSLEPDPKVTSVDVTEVDSTAGGNVTIVVTGEDFTSGGTIAFVGSSAEFNADTSTFNSATQYTAVKTKASFLNAQEPYKVRFTSTTGKVGLSSVGLINVDSAPTWTTNAGNLATIYDAVDATHATVAASDAEGDTIAYTETGATNLTGAGLTLNSSTGVISGNPNDVNNDTTVSFTLRATANSKTADRAFNIIVKQALDGSSQAKRAFSAQDLVNSGTSSGTKWVDINGSAYQMEYDSTNRFSTGISGWLKFDNSFRNTNGGSLSPSNSSSSHVSGYWDNSYQHFVLGHDGNGNTGATEIGYVQMRLPRLQYAHIETITASGSGGQTPDDTTNWEGSYEGSIVGYGINKSASISNPAGYPFGIWDDNLSNSWDTTNDSIGSTGNIILPNYGGVLGSTGGSVTKNRADWRQVHFASFNASGDMYFVAWTGDSGQERYTYTNFEMWIH